MWDFEGKEGDEYAVKKSLSQYDDYAADVSSTRSTPQRPTAPSTVSSAATTARCGRRSVGPPVNGGSSGTAARTACDP